MCNCSWITLRRFSLVFSLSLLILLAACSGPQIQPLSNQKIQPSLGDSAIIAEDAYRLPLRQFWPPGQASAIVIALHGFNDYSLAFQSMCEHLVAENIACLAYDQRGFGASEFVGLWPGEGRLQSDLELVTRLVRVRYPGMPIYLVGESMGAAVILTSLASASEFWQQHISGGILLAPAVWARETQPWYQRWLLNLAVYTVPFWQPTGEGLEIQATDNIAALRQMGRDPLVIKATRIDAIYGLTNLMDKALALAPEIDLPSLVLYGEKDEVIPREPTCRMAMAMREHGVPMDFVLYPDGYHMLTRDLQAKRVFNDMVRWMRRDLTVDPSLLDSFC